MIIPIFTFNPLKRLRVAFSFMCDGRTFHSFLRGIRAGRLQSKTAGGLGGLCVMNRTLLVFFFAACRIRRFIRHVQTFPK